MTSQSIPQAVEPVKEPEPTPKAKPNLIQTVYSIHRKPYSFYMKIINLYDDGTWEHVGNTYDEPLPHLFNHLEKLLMKGIKL